MRKCIKILLSILLTLGLILITMSFIIENIVVKTFSQEILSKKISGYFLDEIIYDVDINTLEKIEYNIRNSEYTSKITSKFIQTITKNVAYNENINFDISKEIDLLISENMPVDLYNEKVNSTKEYLNKTIANTEKTLEENLVYSFGDYYITILKLYNILTNIYFRIVMLLTFIICIIGLVIIEKYKSLRAIQISCFITAIITGIAFVAIKLLSNFIDQRLAGGWLSSINLSLMITFIIIEFIISLGLFIVRKKSKFDNNDKNKD